MADQRTYNFALEVDPASTSAYISSIAVLYILAVCGRLSLSLHETVSKYVLCDIEIIDGEKTYVGVNSSFSIVNGSTIRRNALTFS